MAIDALPRVLVLMATYNGERYLEEQIESILSQQGVNVSLWISDDCSTDSTYEICKKYAVKHSNVRVSQNTSNKRVARNFMDMVYEADAGQFDYFAFSDQDDVWFPQKLSHAIELIKCSGLGPRLYYSDVLDVDVALKNGRREIAPFRQFASSLKLVLVLNWVLGCTMVFNSEFLLVVQRYRPPAFPRNHDGWLHLIGVACEWVVPDYDSAQIYRRITGGNVVGESSLGTFSFSRIVNGYKMAFIDRTRDHTESARYVLEGYSDLMPSRNLKIISEFIEMGSSFTGRLNMALDEGFRGPQGVENILYMIKMVLGLY